MGVGFQSAGAGDVILLAVGDRVQLPSGAVWWTMHSRTDGRAMLAFDGDPRRVAPVAVRPGRRMDDDRC